MILENIKKDSWGFLRIVMALVFLSAAIFRIFYPEIAQVELQSLGLSQILIWPLIILEFAGGLCLLFNYQIRLVAIILVVFLFLALVQALFINYQGIIKQLPDLFVFRANALDWFLHLMFIFILISFVRRS